MSLTVVLSFLIGFSVSFAVTTLLLVAFRR